MHPDLLGDRATPQQRVAARAEGLRPLLLRIAAARLNSRELAEDVVQDALLLAVRCPAPMERWELERFRAWLIRTVVHLCSQTLKQRGSEARRDMRLAAHMAACTAEERVRAEQRRMVPLLLRSVPLSPQERTCLKLRLDGRSDSSIAGQYGLEEASVRKYVSRAVRKMREAVRESGD